VTVLCRLHWLPVRQQRAKCKASTLVRRPLSEWPEWWLLPRHCVPQKTSLGWHSTLVNSWTHADYGNRALSIAGLWLCNYLPPDLWQPDLSYSQFRQLLKMFSREQWDHSAAWAVFHTAPVRNTLTYLLTNIHATVSCDLSVTVSPVLGNLFSSECSRISSSGLEWGSLVARESRCCVRRLCSLNITCINSYYHRCTTYRADGTSAMISTSVIRKILPP